MSWDAMRGDNRARFCDQCQKHVYNFAAMTTDEGLALIARTEGEFCGRLTRREDGMLMTADCPVGFAARLQRFRRRVAYSVIAVCLMIFGFVSFRQIKVGVTHGTGTANVSLITATLEDWLNQLRAWAGWTPRRTVVTMGGCSGPPPTMGKMVVTGGK
jgi:hypothetical protein